MQEANIWNQKGPFKVDHVGSLLRPERLKKARFAYEKGEVTKAQLKEVEDQEISRIVQKQIDIGLKAVTDGEFRRGWWHLDFMWGLNGIEQYRKDHGYQFADGIESEPLDVRTTGKISWNTTHDFLEHFKYLKKAVGAGAIAKLSIPSPNQFLHEGIRREEHYESAELFAEDLKKVYIDAVQAFYDLGCRYLQLDDVFWGFLAADGIRGGVVPEEEWLLLKRLSKEMIQTIIEHKPKDLTLTTHVCRGNYKSSYAAAGPYYPVAKELFDEISYDGYFLEYDDDRSGDFGPLEHFSGEGKVVLGLMTSKFPELEDIEVLKNRINEAAQYVPKEQLCISPQCGFASTEEGNLLTEEQQWAKLSHLINHIDEIFSNKLV
ncbi:5-methyltetrahydropteroyltriglutamate--homocysteine S-methyltransferase [Marinilactibacillus sp. GCM10026970]|uniref:5-methyltetrahydropteroyltriglutamate-- homocysteine S-methyltransferase n=1 Tax=Marinilactibacillus sp. GCM10026970 TaxID=3252642 RepID=UPI003618D32D